MDAKYKWFIAFRPWSFTAAIVPVTLGGIWAAYQGYFNVGLFLLTLIGGVLIQAGTNLVNTYYDYKNGVDTEDWVNTAPVLIKNWIEPYKVLFMGFVCFGLALAIGIYLMTLRGIVLLLVGLFGILAGYHYTGGLAYKYKGLGSLLVFFLMGPVMVWASYYVQTGFHSWSAVLVSLPIGFLVSAILHSNDLRDLEHDIKAGVKTGAIFTGRQNGIKLYYLLNILPFACVVVLVAFGILPVWTILSILLAVPEAVKIFKQARQGLVGDWASIETLEQKAAQFHFQFGTLFALGILVAIWL
ncbi:MAG: 1,4-dihydroxy-2-naphthoate octaprenyltransferase [Peptococcaceae bacterium]|nr:1,4-dihydroxy-2-naphthoate octaprenyltransferase [Peptococcaceae bacterium]